MSEERLERVESKVDRLETKVDGLDTRLGALETTVHDGFEQVYRSMGEGFAEHRSLLVEHVDRRLEGLRSEIDRRIDRVRDELRGEFRHGFETVRDDLQSEMRAGFGGLDAKLGEFIATQSAFNRWVMERLGEG